MIKLIHNTRLQLYINQLQTTMPMSTVVHSICIASMIALISLSYGCASANIKRYSSPVGTKSSEGSDVGVRIRGKQNYGFSYIFAYDSEKPPYIAIVSASRKGVTDKTMLVDDIVLVRQSNRKTIFTIEDAKPISEDPLTYDNETHFSINIPLYKNLLFQENDTIECRGTVHFEPSGRTADFSRTFHSEQLRYWGSIWNFF